MRILLIEDDELLSQQLVNFLTNQNYTIDVASDGRAGLEQASLTTFKQTSPAYEGVAWTYDLILLDVMLPQLDGISICRKLRELGIRTPILLLTAENNNKNKAIGLDAGADDYLTKPFNWEELSARIRALLRRGNTEATPILRWGNLHLDPGNCQVTHQGIPISLTPKEYSLLELFLRNKHRVFSRSAILDRLWSFETSPGEETVTAHIKGLRQKLKKAGLTADPIETIYGIGYRLREIENQPKKSKLRKSVSPDLEKKAIEAAIIVWQRVKEKLSSRVATIERATTAMLNNKLGDELRQQSIVEAHKLAGSLGMFDLDEGLRDSGGNLIGATGTASDITDAKHREAERKQSEEALRESEARFRQLAENIREVLWIRDAEQNRMIYISPAYESVWGHPRSQLYVLYPSFLDTIYPQDRDRFLEALARQNESGYDEEYRIVRPDGSIRWVHDRAFPIKNEVGNVYRIVGLAEDITERKEAETELIRQNRRSQLFAELAFKIRQSLRLEEILPTAVAEVQKFLQADRVLLFRLSADGSGTVLQEEVIPPYPVTLGQQLLDPCFREGYAEQYRQGRISAIVDLDRAEIDSCHREFLQQFQVKANLVVPILQQDRLWGLLIAHQCSSPRQWTSFEINLLQRLADQIGIALSQGQLVEALRGSEERFRTMADSAPVLLWIADTNKLCSFFNQSWLNFRGRTLEEEMGNGWQEGVHPEDLPLCIELYNTAFDERESFQMEYRLQRADGEYRWMLNTGKPRFLPDGSFAGYIGSCVDISDRREVEKLKDEFISIVSHELRTPLTSIQGALDLLAGGALADRPEYAQHMLNIAAKNADRLVRLINDMLDIERIESGKVTMTKQVCDAADLMSSAVDALENMARQAKVNLSVSPLSARLWADPDRIIQVLTNLLSNAIKFSPPDSTVWLTAEMVNREDSSSTSTTHILFKIKDRGRGIPVDKLETIFGRFQQVDASDSRKKGGTGLGLAICRSIVHHHDGQIWAESRVMQISQIAQKFFTQFLCRYFKPSREFFVGRT
jgi:PAS domain S-box-containing protein